MLNKNFEDFLKFLGISKEEKEKPKAKWFYSKPICGKYSGVEIVILAENDRKVCSLIIAEGIRFFDTKSRCSLIGFAMQKPEDPHGTSIVTISKSNMVDAAHMIADSIRTVAEKDFYLDLSEVSESLSQSIERYVVNQWTICCRP